MRWITALVICLMLAGCNDPASYYGKCTIEKVDGKVVKVQVMLPPLNSQGVTYEITDQDKMDKLIDGLESLILDLKNARDQMKIHEQKGQ